VRRQGRRRAFRHGSAVHAAGVGKMPRQYEALRDAEPVALPDADRLGRRFVGRSADHGQRRRDRADTVRSTVHRRWPSIEPVGGAVVRVNAPDVRNVTAQLVATLIADRSGEPRQGGLKGRWGDDDSCIGQGRPQHESIVGHGEPRSDCRSKPASRWKAGRILCAEAPGRYPEGSTRRRGYCVNLARPAGIEPATLGFGGQYSIP
jgi:hypothetical protein